MKICINCKKTANDDMNFCASCGNALSVIEPEEPAKADTYSAPEQTETYTVYNVKKPSLGLKITGMALSISGFSFLVIGALYTLVGLIEPGVAFGIAFTFSLFFLPLCIVGFVLSKKAKNAGDNSAFSRVGFALGLAGIIIAGACLFIGLIGVMGY